MMRRNRVLPSRCMFSRVHRLAREKLWVLKTAAVTDNILRSRVEHFVSTISSKAAKFNFYPGLGTSEIGGGCDAFCGAAGCCSCKKHISCMDNDV